MLSGAAAAAGRAGRAGARQKSAMIQSQRHFRLYWSDTCARGGRGMGRARTRGCLRGLTPWAATGRAG
jgi:hypothetical protein